MVKNALAFLVLMLVAALLLLYPSNLRASSSNKDIQTMIHLLDYIAKDYSGAVQEGKITSSGEYDEMLEFSNTVYDLAKQTKSLQKEEKLLVKVKELKVKIERKSSSETIAFLAHEIRSEILRITDYLASPLQWPDQVEGKKSYTLNCAPCHGVNGNGQGKLAAALNPAPANFLNDTLMKEMSPFQAYNTIRLGIAGTAMKAFPKLSDKEVWDIAFYIKSLWFRQIAIDTVLSAKLFKQASAKISLLEVSTLNDKQLAKKVGKTGYSETDLLTSLRLHSSEHYFSNSLGLARRYIQESLGAYKEKKFTIARQKALGAYLEGIEPVETRLRANDPKFTADIEKQMLDLRAAIEERHSVSQVEEVAKASLDMISKADKILTDSKLTYWLSFLLSASILIREGLEAFLIIAVILTLIKSSGTRKALPWLHGGWITAIGFGFLGWFFSGWILDISGRNREIMEGAVALFAVVVLTFVGFWLHSNSHARQWKAFIEDKVNKLINKESMLGIAFFSFIVVFREAFESVLFLQAISLETAPDDQSAIGLGVLAAFALIALLMILFLKFSKKIPVRQLFRYSAWMITVLAVVLIGKGIHAIQESGVFPVTELPWNLRLEWAGIYPTFETIVAQIVLLALILLLWFIQNKKMQLVS